ncbi:amino acid ABC transporter substrate-binding protein [Candidatus Poriferisocius sp.]|uniref:amino acid ABC transporter substrate-binding protein n=1 Tax=Candidatus Poriferisocius sp. TaxID=3101276 RepID=UPI003B02A310
MQKTIHRLLALLGLVLAFSLIAASCGNDDSDEGGAAPAAPEATEAATQAPEPTEAPEATVDLIQDGGTLQAVLDRGHVLCGSRDDVPGFALLNEDGQYEGFDIDMCRVVAAAVFGDADAVEIVPVTSAERFTALASGQFEVMNRNTTWTATRDGTEGAEFLFTTYYDGQGLMVPASTGFTTLEDLEDANICVSTGTTTELNLTAVFAARGIPFNPVTFEGFDTLVPAYEEGQCEAMTADSSVLGVYKFEIEAKGGPDQHIMTEIISKEPLGTVVRDGDSQWAQVVNWATMATVQAWEFGLDSSNIGSYDGNDPNILNFLGRDGFDPGLGLPTDFAVNVVEQVGNYEEIFNRYPQLGVLEGSVNDLWTNGGLMYVPPYR